MPRRRESKPAELSLYCKQWTIERVGQDPWACGPSAAVTAMRLAGNRDLQADELPALVREWGDRPTDGITREQLVALVRAHGHPVHSFNQRLTTDEDAFKAFLQESWRRHRPTVVAWCCDDVVWDHYVCAYANPDDEGVWVMDPIDDRWVFTDYTWEDFLEYSGDQSKGHYRWEAHAVAPRDSQDHPLPPSCLLFDWINELPGAVEEKDFLAAAFCDNLLDEARPVLAGRGVPLAELLAEGGPLWQKLSHWDVYYHPEDMADLETMRAVGEDLAAWLELRIDLAAVDGLLGDLALVFVHSLMYWRRLEEAAG